LETLKKIGVDKRDRESIKILYMGQTAVARIEEVDLKPGIIGWGVELGLFIVTVIVHPQFVDEALDNVEEAVKVGLHSSTDN